jgi:hypothetical protein
MTEREESATETPPADEILPNGKNEETVIMQFDLHSDLANQITIENLKWHLASLRDSDWSTMHSEDVTNYGETMAALIEVLGYFGEKQ